MAGLFVVLEGAEGVGKSTQVALLADWLGISGIPHLSAREPGGTLVGEAIRSIVLAGTNMAIPPETELLLILAARAAFVREIVGPALERGEVVVADRFDLSTFAYQGFGRGLDLDQVRELNAFATGGLEPDLYVILDLATSDGFARKGGQGASADRFEGAGGAFLKRVRQGYHSLARGNERAVLLDGSPKAEVVHGQIREILISRFPETFDGCEV